jgi:anti-sigma regulatory factor (Ser/Thr protein kinase)
VRELLAPRLTEEELARVVLVTSELVTNAVMHPRVAQASQIGLRVRIYPSRVRIEVEDAGEGFQLPIPVSPGTGGGRGLFLVESCAAQWGSLRALTEQGPRFRVWFELESGAGGDLSAGGS